MIRLEPEASLLEALVISTGASLPGRTFELALPKLPAKAKGVILIIMGYRIVGNLELVVLATLALSPRFSRLVHPLGFGWPLKI